MLKNVCILSQVGSIYFLVISIKKNRTIISSKKIAIKKYGKKHYRNDQKIYATYLRQYTNIFQHLNLPNISTKPKCIPSKKMNLNLQNTYIVYFSLLSRLITYLCQTTNTLEHLNSLKKWSYYGRQITTNFNISNHTIPDGIY